jgi:hypothetical protein
VEWIRQRRKGVARQRRRKSPDRMNPSNRDKEIKKKVLGLRKEEERNKKEKGKHNKA